MKAPGSKVMCQVLFRPMLSWVLDNCKGAGIGSVCVVVGKNADDLKGLLPPDAAVAVQAERLGTGHATLQARALLHGRLAATREDVQALTAPVLRHRLLLSFAAEAEGKRPDALVAALLDELPFPGG